ncbi:uncharacterized protein LOC142823854 [Pelodiscus sinensis]|uniref:uncharacterized protein LOC142823852 n=1 Tax=Pelodiscus sinensis TaxID=13735 RepID=UPI003F6D785B
MEPRPFLEWFSENQQQQRQAQQEQQAQLVQQLTTQFQEHQRLLIQELAAQQERWRQTVERRWGTPAGAPGTSGEGPNLPLRLTKLGPQDDPEAFLTTFERVATAARWPPDQWATLLAPYLSGPAQLAYRSLAVADALNYPKVREAILDQVGHSPETCRQKFRQEVFRGGDRPRAVAQRLKEWANRWLEPEHKTGSQVSEMVVMEQFIHILPRDGQRWVRRNQPATLNEAVTLMEAHLLAEREEGGAGRANPPTPKVGGSRSQGKPPGGEPSSGGRRGRDTPPRLAPVWPRPPPERTDAERRPEGGPREVRPGGRGPCFQCGQEGHFKRECPLMDCTLSQGTAAEPREDGGTRGGPLVHRVWLEGRPVQALVDSGSTVTLVRADLVPPGHPEGEPVWMRCVHGDVKAYPTVQLRLTGGGQDRVWPIGKAKTLPYPVLIGRDWPGFELFLKGQDPPAEEGGREGAAGDLTPAAAEKERAICLELETAPDFLTEQRMDPTLQHAWDQAGTPDEQRQGEERAPQGPQFQVWGDRLYRVTREAAGGVRKQLVVPTRFRREVLELGHAVPWAGHLGREKTLDRVLQRFFWPGIFRAVRDFCDSCPECQRTAPARVPKAPLVPMPIVAVPFERIAMDLVGPLEPSGRGHRYIMVVVDYATRYPEAIPLRNTKAPTLARELLRIFSRVGLPQAILTDQGPNVTSRVMKELCKMLKIHRLRTSVYHPQTDGLVERFNKTLKEMLRRFVLEDPRGWDLMLPSLMFAVREVPQASTGFSPFELLYGRRCRGILDLLKEGWENQASTGRGTVQYITQLREKLSRLGEYARRNLEDAQHRQARYYDANARRREFQPGDRVMLLLPTKESKLLAQWQGPFEVIKKVGEVDYEIRLSGRRQGTQLFHVNLLKKWVPRDTLLIAPPSEEEDLGPWGGTETGPVEASLNPELTPAQQGQLRSLLHQYQETLTSRPGRTMMGVHQIVTEVGRTVREPLRPLPRKAWDTVRREIQLMRQWGVIEESVSEWRSPIVLVPKADGSTRFCIDFRKVNAISRFDAYPMPRVDELLERLGQAVYISTLDLSKGYWQIPLDPQAQEKTAFSTPFGLFQFRTMPFGLHGAAATFQRVMDRVLAPYAEFTAAYIDDIVIYSRTWEEHLGHLRTMPPRWDLAPY